PVISLRWRSYSHVHASGSNDSATSRVLRISLVITLGYIVLLVMAGIRALSLALLSEAGHLSDFVALLLSWGRGLPLRT
ncbi:MAG TPA: hypothetical protein VF772_11950, partial [Terriglobales bacterium]